VRVIVNHEQELNQMKEIFKEMLLEHIDARTYHMQSDKTYVFGWLLGDPILASTTELEQMYLERMLNLLVVCGETEVEIAGLDEEGRTLYQRIV
jgi:hypothetical protein